jgi:hypothetical protein
VDFSNDENYFREDGEQKAEEAEHEIEQEEVRRTVRPALPATAWSGPPKPWSETEVGGRI